MRAQFEKDGTCTVFAGDGSTVACFPTVYEPAFNNQYEQPLTEEGKLLVGTWERGLFCYDVATGELLWRQGPGRVRQLLVSGATVVVEMHGRGIWQRELATGEVLARINMSGMDTFLRLDDLLFAGPRRNHYFLIELADLSEYTTISAKRLNPDSCLSFCIERVQRNGTSLQVSGRERHPHRRYSEIPASDFSRLIEDVF